MSDSEFGGQAADIAVRIPTLPPDDQIAAACRGSGNPVALAWLAENLGLTETSTLVDLGAGLGGPAAWMRSRYRCTVVAAEPEPQAARAASSIFAVPTLVAAADRSPFATDSFDAALLLGVVSVVADPAPVLAETSRIVAALGLLDYCSTGRSPVAAGGSTFPTERGLREMIGAAFRLDQFAAVAIDTPDRWTRAADAVGGEPDPDEEEVGRAIDEGRIAAFMLVASR